MPLYEYKCTACGHLFEKIQRYSDPAIDTCPKCGGSVEKLLSSPAIQFKGSGWYITDYARKSSGDSTAGKTNDDKTTDDKKTDDKKSDGKKTDKKAETSSSADSSTTSSATSSSPAKDQ